MTLSKLTMFSALPAYHGGKRRLLGRIFKHAPSRSEAPVFADAFLGGGAVSLFAKARGYQVVCNDIAERSAIVGRALISNDRVTLTSADIVRLFVPEEHDAFVERNYCPTVVTSRHARFLDNALVAARRAEEPKRSLFRLLLIKYVLRQRPMGNFGAKTIVEQLEDGRYDEVNPTFLRGSYVTRVNAHPKVHVEALRKQVNSGVFGSAGPCSVHQLDVREFLAGIEADVAYLDPPYAGTMGYETALKVLDSILAGHEVDPEPSPFSGPQWLETLSEMFESARHIPTWILSFGNVATDAEGLAKLMRRFDRDVDVESVAYAHCASLAGEQSRAKNREFIIVGRSR